MATLETIQNILNENLDSDPADVTPEASLEDLGIDSLDMAELICNIEEELDIDFGEPEGLLNVGDVVKYLEAL